MRKIIDNAEQAFLAKLAKVPDGTWRERSYVEVAVSPTAVRRSTIRAPNPGCLSSLLWPHPSLQVRVRRGLPENP